MPGIEFGTGMIERCAKLGKSVYLLGAKPGVAEQAAENLKNRFPGLVIAGTHDGYFKEDAPIAAEIKASGADMALVCLGAPKQELFMAKYGEATGCHLLMGLGGSMDILRASRSARRSSTASIIWSGSTASSKIRPVSAA